MYVRTANPILLKDDVGKAKPCTRRLMPTEFAYGLKPASSQEGVKECEMIRHQSTSGTHPNSTPANQ